jgi:hypothetical protein
MGGQMSNILYIEVRMKKLTNKLLIQIITALIILQFSDNIFCMKYTGEYQKKYTLVKKVVKRIKQRVSKHPKLVSVVGATAGVVVGSISHSTNSTLQNVEQNKQKPQSVKKLFLESVAEKYIEGMRNNDLSKGEVFWGGDIELGVMAKIYDLEITVIDNLYQTKATIGKKGARKIKILHQNDNHYKYYASYNDANNLAIDVAGDGNCMLRAILAAQRVEQSDVEIIQLRNNIAEVLSQDQEAQKSIRMLYEVIINAANDIQVTDAVENVPSGKLRDEGKEYITQDGDVFHFMFNN